MTLKFAPLERGGPRGLSTLLPLLGLCGVLQAAQFGDFTYTDQGSYVTITDYPTFATGAVAIPASINGKPVKRIGSGAFSDCSSLTSVTIPAGVTILDQDAFAYCGSLGNVSFPSGLTTIGEDAFAYCHGITAVNLPAQVNYVGPGAFSTCSGLTSISVSASNPYFTSAGGVLFDKPKTTLRQYPSAMSGSYTVPSTVTRIGDEAFFGADGLTAVKIPAGVTTIGDLGFYGCDSLTQVSLPAALTTIGSNAFAYSGLTAIAIPNSVTSIGNHGFANCYSLASATISASVTSLGLGVFASCGSLTALAVSPNNIVYCSEGGVVFDKSKTTLVQFPSGFGGYYEVPPGVTSIAGSAFTGSRMLTAVSLPVGLTTIGSNAFAICSDLNYVDLPVGLTHIKSSAFWSCSSLTGVTIPSTVTSLEFYAFYGCSALSQATFRGNAPVMASVVFSSVPAAFEIRYYQNRTGFSTPTWLGFKTKNLGDLSEAPAEILVQTPSGGDLADNANTEDFGSLEPGEWAARTFTIRNAGEVPLTDLAATCDGSNAANFTVGFPASTSLPPGGSTTITVTFQATAGGEREALLSVFSNDADENPFEVALIGNARVPVPEIAISQPVGSGLVDEKAKKSFGTVVVGKTGNAKTFTITNKGTAKLTGLVIRKDGTHKADFKLGELEKTTLAAGASITFKVTFKPTAKGTREAAIHVGSNDADENPFDIKLTGMGAR